MNIILLGLFFSEKSLEDAYHNSKCAVQLAPHKFQTNLLSGFESLDGINIEAVNVLPIGSYPINYRKLYIKSAEWGNNHKQVGFVNLPMLKRLEQINKIVKEVSKRIKKFGEKNTAILIYHTFKPFLRCAEILKKRFPALKITLIMTDPIPGRGDFDRKMTKRAKKTGDKIVKMAKVCDSFVLLTKFMTEAIEVGDRPYTIVECISDSKQPRAKVSNGTQNICLYTGTVDKDFGIIEVAEAFKKISNAKLLICGGGNAAERLAEISKESGNVKYFGFLPQDKVADLRDQCDFLINPRRPTGTFTKYSFPSKTAEYMASGKPVIMYKLEGVPDEYDTHLNYLTSSDPDGIATELQTIFNTPYNDHLIKANGACRFIREEKSPISQASKIINLIAEA